MRVLILSANLGGNVPPTLAIAEELCRRGVDVQIAGLLVGPQPAGSFDATEGGGTRGPTELAASWAPRRDASGAPEPLSPTLGRIFFSRRAAREVEALIHERRPDVVAADCMALALISGANRTGIPVVILLHTFAEYWRRHFLRGPLARIAGGIGFSPRALWGAAADRLLLTDPVLDPAGGDPAFAAYTWTGTTEVGVDAVAPSDAGSRPRVLVSFSTTPLAGMRRTYRNVIDALGRLPVEATVTTGGFDLGRPAPSAPNVEVRGFVPHAEVLPGAALVIGHGGHSTTMKSLAHGIPLLVLPLNPTADQKLIGGVVDDAGLGRRLSARSDPVTLRREIAALIEDDAVRARARETGRRLRAARPGAQVAADRVIAAASAARGVR